MEYSYLELNGRPQYGPHWTDWSLTLKKYHKSGSEGEVEKDRIGSRPELNDLPDEILLIIFKKVDNVTILNSLFGVNQRLHQILQESIFTSHLNLLNVGLDDSICQLSDSILDRFCLQILPKIYHKVKWLNLESSSMARILLTQNYPNLNGLGLYNLEKRKAIDLFSDQNLLFHRLQSEILSLVIRTSHNENSGMLVNANTILFTQIFTMFTNLKHFNFASTSIYYQTISFNYSPPLIFSSNLLELHVSLEYFTDCLYLLDGRFSQLRTLHVDIIMIHSFQLIDNKEKLPNLRCFALNCDIVGSVDELVVPLLHRMSNLEELSLNISIVDKKTFVDGNKLNDITNHMIRLNKFTFNIHSTIVLDNQIDLPSNENIQNTFKNSKYNQIISCIDYFPEARDGQCRIYSYPYTSKEYNKITNNFPGGLFKCVREISLFDEQPFEHDFFLRIAESFPLMKKLTLINQKPQKNKKSKDLSIVKYPHLNDLNLDEVHDDYLEQFLFHTKTYLPYNVELVTDHRQLEKVTHNFKRDSTRVNSSRKNYWYYDTVSLLEKHFKDYFFHIRRY